MSAAEHIATFDEALTIVLDRAHRLEPLGVETVALLEARDRVLARAVQADRDQPPFDRSTRDGFAVRANSYSGGVGLRIVGSIRAGHAWSGPRVEEGEAVRIMTGAPLPDGADAVAMIEHVATAEETIQAKPGRTLKRGENVVARGSEARARSEVLAAGTCIGAAEIALAAACGCAELAVFLRPRVAIVATGDELVELDREPAPHQIRNSNSYALAALVADAGGEPVRLPIALDRREDVAASIAAARACDLIVLSGGVSMGEYDLVEEMLLAQDAQFHFTGVTMQPGRPVVFGQMQAKYFFGLPGNPISTQVTFHCFVEPLLRAMCGEEARGPRWVLAELLGDVAAKPGLTRLMPARIDDTRVRLVGWQGSGDLAANARANCYMLLPADRESFRAGEVVRVLLR
jgi:molybdopterin molybdotransferase